MKIFSGEWCEAALEAEQAASDEIRPLLRDPDSFTHVLALEAQDRPGVASYLHYVEGHSVTWTTEAYPEELVWGRFVAPVEVWRQAFDGVKPAGSLIMSGKIKVAKGSLQEAAAALPAFAKVCVVVGSVPTEWE